jgi:hypothetical protein
MDGSKKVIAAKNKQRDVVIKNLRLQARYVEAIAGSDMATFKCSGFEPVVSVRAPQVSLSENFRAIDHGMVSGQIVVQMKKTPNAIYQELRFAAVVNGTAAQWKNQLVIRVRTPVVLDCLTPGTVYAFQARSLDKTGYSDWSDSVTFMCT